MLAAGSPPRDPHGVPHIRADSWREALYGLGYMHALDRPTQMLFSRAVASGRAAELIADKPELLETDRFFRRVGLVSAPGPRSRPARRRHVRPADRLLRRRERRPERIRPLAADVGHRLRADAVEPAGRAADRQPAQLRRAGRRPAAERTHPVRADPGRRRRRQDARAVQPAAGRRRLRSAAPASKSPASFPTKRSGADHRPAAAGRQQRLGRQPAAQRQRLGAVGLRSAPGSQPPAGDLVRGGAQLGRSLRDGRHAARLPAVRRGPHRTAWPGA